MRDEINAWIIISRSGVETTDLSLLIFRRWKKHDLVSCLTWVSNDADWSNITPKLRSLELAAEE